MAGELRRRVLTQGVSVDSADSSNRTALHRAAARGDADMVCWLLQKGADVDAADVSGCTALHGAAAGGHAGAVACLLEVGANYDATDGTSITPLMAALQCSPVPEQLQVMQLLLQAGADGNKLLDPLGYRCVSMMQYAALTNQPQAINQLAGHNVSVHGSSTSAECPLLLAVSWGAVEAAECLLRWGASASITGFKQQTPLHAAVAAAGAPLHLGWERVAAMVQLLLQLPLNQVQWMAGRFDEDGRTVLSIAAMHGQIHVVEMLLVDLAYRHPDYCNELLTAGVAAAEFDQPEMGSAIFELITTELRACYGEAAVEELLLRVSRLNVAARFVEAARQQQLATNREVMPHDLPGQWPPMLSSGCERVSCSHARSGQRRHCPLLRLQQQREQR